MVITVSKTLDKDDVNGIFDEMFPQPEEPKRAADMPENTRVEPWFHAEAQAHSDPSLAHPNTEVTEGHGDPSPQGHITTATRPYSDTVTQGPSDPVPPHHVTVPNDCSWVESSGTLRRKGIYIYAEQLRRLRRLVVAGQDAYGMGLNESVAIRCAIELLLRLGIEPHQGMTEEELWQEVVKGGAKMNIAELMLYVEMALKRAGLGDRADHVLSELHWLLDTCTPDEIRQMGDE